MPLFCRHNRFLQNCPICSREEAAKRPAPATPPRTRAAGSGSSTTSRRPSRPRSGAVVVKRAYRAVDDGYSSPLVPGIRGSGDAARLAALVAVEDLRLTALGIEPPPPWDAVASAPDASDAAERAMTIVLGERDAGNERTWAAYRAWVARMGSAEAAFTGDADWPPARRFERIFDRLAFPGFGRARRFTLLVGLGATGVFPLEVRTLRFGTAGGDDDATLAAKRVLNSGDPMLLDRRAAALADALGVPLAVLDGAFAAFEAGERPDDEDAGPALGRMRTALGL